MMKKMLWLLTICAGLSGCATWSKVEKSSFTAQDRSYTAELPVGWARFHLGRTENDVFITYDGPRLDRIEIAKRENKDAFPKIKKTASENMLAFELAELMVAELKTDDALANIEVVSNAPAMVSGVPGFKLELTGRNPKGVEFGLLVYGVAAKNGFYILTYQAPRLHYFSKYSAAFEQTVASFKLL
jgi:hypothetical protein